MRWWKLCDRPECNYNLKSQAKELDYQRRTFHSGMVDIMELTAKALEWIVNLDIS